MKTVTLGRGGPQVSVLCLGTMTWGSQNTEAEAHAQIRRAAEAGVNVMDAAEMYPTNPVRPETIGRTEEIIGHYLARHGDRDRWVIATKITGEGGLARGGEEITPGSIRRALDASLARLQTDHVDLYQFHWPNRGSFHFRKNWRFDPSRQNVARVLDDMTACMETLNDLVAEGKIRAFGLSNESAWGMAQWLRLAEAGVGPRPLSVQNEYSLLCRLYDTDMAELGHAEEVTLLAYSPLAAGLLSGKYAGGEIPAGSRRSINATLGGRVTPRAEAAVAAYLAIARAAGLDPVAMALAFVRTRPFPVIPIIGATSLDQLDRALASADLTLPADVVEAIEAAHKDHPMPF